MCARMGGYVWTVCVMLVTHDQTSEPFARRTPRASAMNLATFKQKHASAPPSPFEKGSLCVNFAALDRRADPGSVMVLESD